MADEKKNYYCYELNTYYLKSFVYFIIHNFKM